MTKKNLCITAAALILAGAALFFTALARVGFDVRRFSGRTYGTEEISVEEPFSSIDAKLLDCSLSLNPNPVPDGKVRAVVTSTEDAPVTLTVERGVLTVSQKDARPWNRRIAFFETGGASVELYLPQDVQINLHAESMSGDFRCNTTYPFGSAEVATLSGKILWQHTPSDELKLKTTSGDVTVIGSSVRGGITIDTTSGDVFLRDCETESTLFVKTTSGDIEFKNVTASETLTLETVSGQFKTDVTDVGFASLKSTSGDLLLGDLNVEGQCNIKTTSGDVHFLRADSRKFNIETVSGDVTGSLIGEKTSIRGSGSVSNTANTATPWSITTSSGYHHIYPAE